MNRRTDEINSENFMNYINIMMVNPLLYINIQKNKQKKLTIEIPPSTVKSNIVFLKKRRRKKRKIHKKYRSLSVNIPIIEHDDIIMLEESLIKNEDEWEVLMM